MPIAAPSANRFTELSPTHAAHVPRGLADYVVDGGPARVGIESTVLSLAGAPTLLRPGVIPLTEIAALIGPVLTAEDPAEGAHGSPGLHPRHYRPATPRCLVDAERIRRGNAARGWHREEMPADPVEYAAVLYETLTAWTRNASPPSPWSGRRKLPNGPACSTVCGARRVSSGLPPIPER